MFNPDTLATSSLHSTEQIYTTSINNLNTQKYQKWHETYTQKIFLINQITSIHPPTTIRIHYHFL